MEKILSVSVACYNLGDMILKNLKSFCESDVADLVEVIVTDDGSKDNTPDIVEEYAKQYPNTIKLIRKENGGPGSTVNSGIKNATGKYFRMVDGDDWVNTQNLNEFVKFLQTCDSDMVVADYELVDQKSQEVVEKKTFNLPPKEQLNFDSVFKDVPNEMHAITFKTEIFQNNNITLDNGFYTDVEYALFPIKYVKTVSYFNKTIYEYLVGQAGQSVNVNSMIRNLPQHDIVLKRMTKFYEDSKEELTQEQKKFLLNRLSGLANTQLWVLLNLEISKENKRKVKEFFKSVKSKSRCLQCI